MYLKNDRIDSSLRVRTPEPIAPSLSCTVVVCTRDRPRHLETCLSAIQAQDYPTFDILVVDSGPRQSVDDIAGRFGAGYTLEQVGGLSRARNVGARMSKSDVVAYIDDDAVPETGWLGALMREFSDSAVAAVTGHVHNVWSASAHDLASIEEAARHGSSLGRVCLDRHAANWVPMACFGGVGQGNNMALRRSVFSEWSGFDERIGRGRILDAGEENIAFMVLIESGMRVVHTPSAVVRHPFPSTIEGLRANRLRALTASTAHITLLLWEYPQHRFAILRYLLGSAMGVKAGRWRPRGKMKPLSKFEAARAMLAGSMIYLRTRYAKTTSHPR